LNSRVTYTLLALLIITVSLFAWITHQVILKEEDFFDSEVSAYLGDFKTPETKQIMEVFTLVGSTGFLLPAYLIILGILVYKKKTVYAIQAAAIALTSFLLMKLLKGIFRRARPDEAELTNFGFPSGHSVSAFVFICILIYIVWKLQLSRGVKLALSILLLLIALLVGISRIMLGVHYPTDVLAGFSLAGAWVILCNLVFLRLHEQQVDRIENSNN
jgi:membrane-associated phospholipid phosphatase